MNPNGPALDRPIADLLLSCVESGFHISCEPEWAIEPILEVTCRSSHASANDIEVAKHTCAEVKMKSSNGIARCVIEAR